MNVGKKMAVPAGILLAVSLLVTSLCTVFLISYYDRAHFQMMGEICQEIIESQPEAEQIIFSVLKNDLHRSKPLTEAPAEENILYAYGYRQRDFQPAAGRTVVLFAAAGALAGGMLFLLILFFWHEKEIKCLPLSFIESKESDRISGKNQYRGKRSTHADWRR